jgi:hypothetical protein
MLVPVSVVGGVGWCQGRTVCFNLPRIASLIKYSEWLEYSKKGEETQTRKQRGWFQI